MNPEVVARLEELQRAVAGLPCVTLQDRVLCAALGELLALLTGRLDVKNMDARIMLGYSGPPMPPAMNQHPTGQIGQAQPAPPPVAPAPAAAPPLAQRLASVFQPIGAMPTAAPVAAPPPVAPAPPVAAPPPAPAPVMSEMQFDAAAAAAVEALDNADGRSHRTIGPDPATVLRTS